MNDALHKRFPAKPMEGIAYILRLANIANADSAAMAAVEQMIWYPSDGGIDRTASQFWQTSRGEE